VISLFDPLKLRNIIDETLKTTLLVEKVYFVLYDDKVKEYALLTSEDNPRRAVISRSDLMLRGINLLDTPTYFYSLSDYREDSSLAALLEERSVKLILPMKDADHLLGFVALTDKAAGYTYSSEDLNLLGVLSNQMVTALINARLYVESLERIRLQEEVTMARQIQLDLLPSKPPEVPCAVISAHSTPSRTVGGDFFDFVTVDANRIGIVIADASGKGMPAALMIAQTQAILRSEVCNGNPIDIVLKNMNQHIVDSSSAEKYVTLFYGEFNTLTGQFCYANAGHNYPILARANGGLELLTSGGPVIGALPKMLYQSAAVQLQKDDVLFFFTDGLSEAMNEHEEEYTEDRIRKYVMDHRNEEPQKLIDMILKDMRDFDPTYPPRDDTTIVALKINNGFVAYDGQA
jgi:sigma-B regulation protein RsbU (phosphoserine phosphatase)